MIHWEKILKILFIGTSTAQGNISIELFVMVKLYQNEHLNTEMLIVFLYIYRLYKEEPLNKNDDNYKKRKEKERKKKKKKEKKKKKHKKNRRESISSDEEISNSKWSVVCLTQKDWEDLTAKYKKSKKKSDRELYETLNDNFLPEIVKMFAEREREEKRKLMMLAPKRASNRIERKRFEQEERDRLLAEKVIYPKTYH